MFGKDVLGQARGHDGDNRGKALHNLLTPQQMPSVFRDFVHPGDKTPDLMMRTVFLSDKQANAIVMGMHWLRQFGLEKRGTELVSEYMASRCSIGGRSTLLLLQASTGVVAPSLLLKEKRDVEQVHKRRDPNNGQENPG